MGYFIIRINSKKFGGAINSDFLPVPNFLIMPAQPVNAFTFGRFKREIVGFDQGGPVRLSIPGHPQTLSPVSGVPIATADREINRPTLHPKKS